MRHHDLGKAGKPYVCGKGPGEYWGRAPQHFMIVIPNPTQPNPLLRSATVHCERHGCSSCNAHQHARVNHQRSSLIVHLDSMGQYQASQAERCPRLTFSHILSTTPCGPLFSSLGPAFTGRFRLPTYLEDSDGIPNAAIWPTFFLTRYQVWFKKMSENVPYPLRGQPFFVWAAFV